MVQFQHYCYEWLGCHSLDQAAQSPTQTSLKHVCGQGIHSFSDPDRSFFSPAQNTLLEIHNIQCFATTDLSHTTLDLRGVSSLRFSLSVQLSFFTSPHPSMLKQQLLPSVCPSRLWMHYYPVLKHLIPAAVWMSKKCFRMQCSKFLLCLILQVAFLFCLHSC